MKRKILNTVVSFIILFTGMMSCDKNKTERVDPVDNVKKILELETRMNAMNTGMGKMSNFMSIIGYSQLKDGQLNIEGTNSDPGYSDSIYCDTVDYWAPITCAEVSENDNADGTHTTIYDYGDGCEEYGNLFRGKITYIWGNEKNNYYSKVIYDHYYSFGVEMNGVSNYSFSSDGNSFYSTGIGYKEYSSDSTVSIVPVEFNWSGTSSGHEEITMVYDDGNEIYYLSDYSNKWDSTTYKVLEGEYYYLSKSDGYEYHYLVIEPLITDYTCTYSWVPVSGIETITTTENKTTQSYSLNYGSGICDNLAELTEDGKTSVVDFNELYKTFDDGDGTVVPMNAGTGRK